MKKDTKQSKDKTSKEKTKKKAAVPEKKLPRLEGIEDHIWGILDTPTQPKSKKTLGRKSKGFSVLTPKDINPSLKYDISKTKPELGKKVKLDNSVSMPIELLKSINDKSKRRGQVLADTMLRSVLPSVFGLSSAEDYTTTVLVDGFGVKPEDVKINGEIANVLDIVTSLEMITALVKRTRMPRVMKKALLMKLADELGAGISARLMAGNKSKNINELIKNGIIVSSRKGAAEAEEESLKKTNNERIGKMRRRAE